MVSEFGLGTRGSRTEIGEVIIAKVGENNAAGNAAMRSDEVDSLSDATARMLRGVRPSSPFLLRIEGQSMLPFIPPGTAVKVEPLTGPPRVGDVVVRIHGSGPLIHRVVRSRRCRRSGGLTVVTKGDNALRLDLPCDATEIVGIVRLTLEVGADGKLVPRRLPRVSGVWMARLSHLIGILRAVLARGIPNGKEGKPRRTIAWLVLASRLCESAFHALIFLVTRARRRRGFHMPRR
ncbi:S24/S26 family peptidase [bacterium]|nr:S24/S26 family peptidase [bacterium]